VPDTPESSSSPWRFARWALYLTLGVVTLFFALTRTDVGRNALRQQIEAAVTDRLGGSLHIETLGGSLLHDVVATQVTLRDPEGRAVLSIDSVRATPRWSALLGAELSVNKLAVIRPHLTLHRAADSTWNVQRAVRRSPASESASPLDFAFADIEVREGRVSTRRTGPPPSAVQQGWVFDYTQSTIDSLSAHASLEWRADAKRIELHSTSLSLPKHDLTLQSVQGILSQTDDAWSLDPFSLTLGNTHLEGRAGVTPSDSSQKTVTLALAPSRLDHTELQRLIPRLPLRDTMRVAGQMNGTLNQFVLNNVRLSHGGSSLAAEGTVYGLPELADLDVRLTEAHLHPADLAAVWPQGPAPRLRDVRLLEGTASVLGTVQWRNRPRLSFDLESTLDARSPVGALRGSLAVERTATALRYESDLRADSLNLAPLTERPLPDSRLTGRASIEGTGASFASLSGSGRLTLSGSRLGPARVAQAELKMTANQGTFRGAGYALQPDGGVLSLRGGLGLSGAHPQYELAATAEELDLGAWHPPLPTTGLNGTVTATGAGNTWASAAGEAALSIEPSTLQRGDSTVSVPEQEVSLAIAPRSASAPRVQLGGTLATVSIDGPIFSPSTRSTGRYWGAALREAVRHELMKPLADTATAPAPDSSALRAHHERARSALDTAATTPVSINAQMAVHRMDLLRIWWPQLPPRSDSLRGDLSLTMDGREIRAAGTISARRLDLRSQTLQNIDGAYDLTASHEGPINETLQAEASVHADSARFRNRALVQPSAQFSLADRKGRVQLQVDKYGTAAPAHLDATFDLRHSRNQFRIQELTVGTAEGTWRLDAPSTLSVYSDALRFDSLRVQNPAPSTPGPQQIRINGTFSDRPADTLLVNTERVSLYSLSQLVGVGPAVGGQLDGALALTGGWSRPQVRSNFQVHQLSFDRRVLGTLDFQSAFSPGRPDLAVEAELSPAPPSADSLPSTGLPPGGARSVEPSRLSLSGRIRLPGLTDPTDTFSTDELDLNVQVDRADLFFFEYIFDANVARVRGATAGSIHVGGSFRDPVFDADLNVAEGRFRLPQFGLAYGIEGPVTVDREGIHLQSVTVSDEEGTATLNGSVLFNDYQYFSFDLSGQLDEITIIDVPTAADLPFYGTIRASGEAALTGPLSDATLRSANARTTPDSELFIPASREGIETGTGFIVFADSTGAVPDLQDLTRRDNILADRPAGEPTFIEGLDIDINVQAAEASTVHLVFDPVVGDVVTAQGSGRVQLQRQEGEFLVYGSFNVTEGTYQFTAGEVFVRRFNIDEGTITWDGNPTNAQLALQAEYRTRASPSGLPGYSNYQGRIPVRVQLDISGRVATPQVDLSLSLIREERGAQVGSQTLDAILNQPDRTTEYATSVLLTNTFLLTTESFTQGGAGAPDGNDRGLSAAGNQLAFNSVSQLVASQLNRYLGAALPNVDLSFGLQGEDPSNLDIIYGVALRLLNERLVIRGEGVYTGDDPDERQVEGPQGEFVVEVRLTSRVSAEVFFRRAGDELTRGQTYTQSTGAGLSYQTEFPTWKVLFRRVFGWLLPDSDDSPDPDDPEQDATARRPDAPKTPTPSPAEVDSSSN
jgi:hypothetical protein